MKKYLLTVLVLVTSIITVTSAKDTASEYVKENIKSAQDTASSKPSNKIMINTYLLGYGFGDTFVSASEPFGRGSVLFNESVKTTGGFTWGIGIEKEVITNIDVELSYIMQCSKLQYKYNYRASSSNFYNEEASIRQNSNYIMLGLNKYFDVNDTKLKPFVGAQLGMNVIGVGNMSKFTSSDSGESSFYEIYDKEYIDYIYKSGSTVKFAWGFRAGANYDINSYLAVKVQASLLSSMGVYNNQEPYVFGEIITGRDFDSKYSVEKYQFRPSIYIANIMASLTLNISNL
jgi:opacity protein-like surface antigen